MNNRNAFDPPPPGHFCLTVNMIVPGGKFLVAGQPMPLAELKQIPPTLRKDQYIIRHDPNPEPEPEPSLTFTLGTSYSVDAEGRRRNRRLEREVIDLQRAQQETEAIENALSAEPDGELKAALEVAEENRQASIKHQIAQLEYSRKEREATEQAAQEFVDEDQMLVDDNLNLPVSPTIDEPPAAPAEWSPSKPKLRKRYVRRAGEMVHAKKVKCKAGETVFIKNSAGEFEPAGKVNKRGALPLIFI